MGAGGSLAAAGGVAGVYEGLHDNYNDTANDDTEGSLDNNGDDNNSNLNSRRIRKRRNREGETKAEPVSIDNPDQRISDDINSFTSTSLAFFFMILNATINLVSFSVVLFKIIPFLLLVLFIYALIGNYITTLIGSPLMVRLIISSSTFFAIIFIEKYIFS